jgi:hypothetical protein
MDQLDIYYRALLDYRRAIGSSGEHKAFIKAITQAVERGTERIVVKHPICKVDEDWIIAIEEGLVHIERAIKEERQFITSNGEVLPIEKVKQVSRESVQHLAKHSNLISREPEEDGDIVPDGLYTLERLNDYTVYENRFLYMLLCYMRDFVSLRYNKIEELSTQYEGKLEISREVMHARRKLSYTLTMEDEKRGDKHLRERGSAKDIIKRLSYILDAIHTYLSTPLMQSASHAAMLKPPITKTNVLKMDKNFKGAVALYDYIIAYDKAGYEVDDRERVLSPFENELASLSADMIATVAFVMYEYGLDLNDELQREYEREEQRRKDAEIAARNAQIELVRKRVRRTGLEPEEYIVELEQQIKLLEGESEKVNELYLRIDELSDEKNQLSAQIIELNDKVSDLDSQLDSIEAKHVEDTSKIKEECDERIFALVRDQNLELSGLRDELEQTKRDSREQIMFAQKTSDEKQRACDEILAEHDRLVEENLALSARIKALRAQVGQIDDSEDYSDKESFLELEREYDAFMRFYKKQWGKTKKRIRKELLSPKNFKDRNDK